MVFNGVIKMKNIHILPTPNPSRLQINKHGTLFLSMEVKSYSDCTNQHISITNDEEIKVNDFVLDDEQDVFQVLEINHKQGILRSDGFTYVIDVCKKIILTTDAELIKDGVQPISNEFLEWFVKNPSCEEIEVQKWFDGVDFLEYKIIIPKEEPKQEYQSECICDTECRGFVNVKCKKPKQVELLGSTEKGKRYVIVGKPKQETLEEAADNSLYSTEYLNESERVIFKKGCVYGANWQQEQIGKSEFLQKLRATKSDAEARRLILEQFKNK